MEARNVAIRKAEESDMKAINSFIQKLALSSTGEAHLTEDALKTDGFGEKSWFECMIAERKNEIIGFTLYYRSYSLFHGKYITVQGLYVDERSGNSDIGRALFAKVVENALAFGCLRLEWVATNINANMEQFVKSIDGNICEKWRVCELNKDAMERLASAKM